MTQGEAANRTGQVAAVVDATDADRRMEIRLDSGPVTHLPMQYVSLIAGQGPAVPVPVSSWPDSTDLLEVWIRRTGSMSTPLLQLQPGDSIQVQGPFGQGLDIRDLRDRHLLCAAGGLGMAPVQSLLRWVLARRDEVGRIMVLQAAETPNDLLFTEELESLSGSGEIELLQTVLRPSPGWRGKTGVITALFDGLQVDPLRTTAVVAGPMVLYKFMLLEMMSRGFDEDRIYFCPERRRDCDPGRCRNCLLNASYVCQEGPVFHHGQIRSLPELS